MIPQDSLKVKAIRYGPKDGEEPDTQGTCERAKLHQAIKLQKPWNPS
jgi:hypothetical protein